MSKLEFVKSTIDILAPVEILIASFYEQDIISPNNDAFEVFDALIAYYRAVTTTTPT